MARPNKGADHVDRLDGAEGTKQRLKVILQTMTGELSVQDACELLHVSPARLAELRSDALEGALHGLDPKPPGRPSQAPTPQERQLRALRELVSDLQTDLEASRIRTELALTMPHTLKGKWKPLVKGGQDIVDRLSKAEELGRDGSEDT